MKRAQKRKKRNLWKGFEISKKERNRAVEIDYIIDCNRRTEKNKEPRLID